MTHLDIQAKVTRTSAANGSSIDISGIDAATDWTLKLEILDMNAEATPRIGFEDSVDAFSNKLPVAVWCPTGPVRTQAEKKCFSFKKADFPHLRVGVTSAVLRCALFSINTQGTETITYQAWMEY